MHPKGANSMAASGLVFRSDLVGTGRAISILFGINGVRNLVGPPFPEFKARFSATVGWHFSRDLRWRGSDFGINNLSFQNMLQRTSPIMNGNQI